MVAKIITPFFRQLYAALLAQHVSLMLGVMIGFSSCLIPQLKQESPHLSDHVVVLINVAGTILRPVGSIMDAWLTDILGRRGTLRLAYAGSVFGWAFTANSWNYTTLIIARAYCSIFAGMVTSSIAYVSEMADAKYRASFLSMLWTLQTSGTTVAYLIMYYYNWRTFCRIVCIYFACLFVLLFTIPESPYWYRMKNQREMADASVRWFQIEKNIKNEDTKDNKDNKDYKDYKDNWWTELQRLGLLKRFAATFTTAILINWTGYAIIPNYSVTIFEYLDDNCNGQFVSILYGLVSILCDLSLVYLTAVIDLRRLMIASGTLMIVSLVVCSITTLIGKNHHQADFLIILSSDRLKLYSLFVYACASHLGQGELIWCIVPQLFPTNLRGKILSLHVTVYLIFMSITVAVYHVVTNTVGFVVWLIIFACSTIVINLIVIFCVRIDRDTVYLR